MDSSYVEMKGSHLDSIINTPAALSIAFSRAIIIKTMTGSSERTRWWQTGVLVLEGVQTPAESLAGPLICAGGDIEENLYTYRDMIPIPFASRGQIRCVLRFEGRVASWLVAARSVRLEMDGVPKYLEHLKPSRVL